MSGPLESTCPGCGLVMPSGSVPDYEGYYNASSECWSVATEVLGSEFSDAVLFGQVHQLTVDAYAVQHAGGRHPDKSVDIHLGGLYLMLEQGQAPTDVPRLLQRLAETVDVWPHFEPPHGTPGLTVCEVALAESSAEHATRVRAWAGEVWGAWSEHHAAVADFVKSHL